MSEQFTENFVLKEMKCEIGINDTFGYIAPQGDISNYPKIIELLNEAGGKPSVCNIDDYEAGGKKKAKPEFIVTFNNNQDTIIVIECKKSVKYHRSLELNRPSSFAVDGVLYYAKFLKKEYNVIAIAVSGTQKESMKMETFYWMKKQDDYNVCDKLNGVILEPLNYLKFFEGGKILKDFSINDVRELALDMHDSLREIKVSERHKPIFVAGCRIAL